MKGRRKARFCNRLIYENTEPWIARRRVIDPSWLSYLSRFKHRAIVTGANNIDHNDLSELADMARLGQLNEIVFMIDNDKPGRRSAALVVDKLRRLNLPSTVVINCIRFDEKQYAEHFDIADMFGPIDSRFMFTPEGIAARKAFAEGRFDPRKPLPDGQHRDDNIPPLESYIVDADWIAAEAAVAAKETAKAKKDGRGIRKELLATIRAGGDGLLNALRDAANQLALEDEPEDAAVKLLQATMLETPEPVRHPQWQEYFDGIPILSRLPPTRLPTPNRNWKPAKKRSHLWWPTNIAIKPCLITPRVNGICGTGFIGKSTKSVHSCTM